MEEDERQKGMDKNQSRSRDDRRLMGAGYDEVRP